MMFHDHDVTVNKFLVYEVTSLYHLNELKVIKYSDNNLEQHSNQIQ